MPDQIQFEGEGSEYGRRMVPKPMPAMTRWVVATGLANDEQSAKYVLLTIAVAAFISGAVMYILFDSPPYYAPQNTNNAAYQLNAQYEGGK